MKHFSEFEKDLLKEMTKLGLKIISFDQIIQYSAKFNEKGFALREINIEGQASTVLYLKKQMMDWSWQEMLKT